MKKVTVLAISPEELNLLLSNKDKKGKLIQNLKVFD